MKRITIMIFGLIMTTVLYSQSLSEKVAVNACKCLELIDTYKQLEDSLKNCTTKAMALVMREGTPDEKEAFNSFVVITETFKKVNEILPTYCYNVRRLMIVEKKKIFYKRSLNSNANEHFDKGNQYMENSDYKNAIKEFNKAVKFDNNFIYAIDNLAVSYRKQENYKKSIKNYKKSLDIFPEGDVALLNIAVVYSFLKDNDNSLKYYKELIYLYQDDPEGYFGMAKILFLKSDYEKSLENLFIAHRIYSNTNSKYLKDSEQLINMMHSKMKEINKLDLFKARAEKYNIIINE